LWGKALLAESAPPDQNDQHLLFLNGANFPHEHPAVVGSPSVTPSRLQASCRNWVHYAFSERSATSGRSIGRTCEFSLLAESSMLPNRPFLSLSDTG
jgi:hypothetical protein